jgi:nicotinamide-nucleotide amidase
MTVVRIPALAQETGMDIARQVVSFLISRGLKLATAESCTAGFIASLISSIPGSGACLDVGFVTYSPSGKAGFLGVQKETMELHGLTSEAVAREMSEGALRQEACCADVAVSNTGVADSAPGGGPPPGTQCFAWSFRARTGELMTFSETKSFEGERNEVRRAAALYALSRIEHYFERRWSHDKGGMNDD